MVNMRNLRGKSFEERCETYKQIFNDQKISKLSIKEVCQKYGMSTSTYDKWNKIIRVRDNNEKMAASDEVTFEYNGKRITLPKSFVDESVLKFVDQVSKISIK